MQMAITFMAVVGGLVFSVAVALLAEEVIFEQVICLFFVRNTASAKTGQKAEAKAVSPRVHSLVQQRIER
jgi:hypothetical protein